MCRKKVAKRLRRQGGSGSGWLEDPDGAGPRAPAARAPGGSKAGQQETRTEEGRSGSRAMGPAASGRCAPVTPAGRSFRRWSRRWAAQNQRRPASRLMARATNGASAAPMRHIRPWNRAVTGFTWIVRPSSRGMTRRERHRDREATRRSGYPGSRTKVRGGASGHSPEVLVGEEPIGASGRCRGGPAFVAGRGDASSRQVIGLKTHGSVGR